MTRNRLFTALLTQPDRQPVRLTLTVIMLTLFVLAAGAPEAGGGAGG